MFVHFYLAYVRQFLNTFLFVGPFWRPLRLSVLGSRLVRLMVVPALLIRQKYLSFSNLLQSLLSSIFEDLFTIELSLSGVVRLFNYS